MCRWFCSQKVKDNSPKHQAEMIGTNGGPLSWVSILVKYFVSCVFLILLIILEIEKELSVKRLLKRHKKRVPCSKKARKQKILGLWNYLY
ncbi:hypothetical protein TNCT_150141 [Trichonephila clavata]|uniref:Transmembrane protein n=1 Tax=Trichonephila clavata TaxID=2740835 RepID=A0A8X6GF81_TRICU|nr:hypothetical protein TNCT_150141 [Trichonephila clavata]